MRRSGALLGIHVATALFGFAGLFPHWVKLPSSYIVFGRTFFACLFLIILFLAIRQSLRILHRWHLLAFLLSGVLLALHWFSFFHSIQLSTVAVGLLAYSCFPVFLVVLEPFFFREKFRPSNLLLVSLNLVGVYLIKAANQGDLKLNTGLLWGLLSGFTFAMLILINRALGRSYSAFQIAFWQDLFAFISLVPFVSPTRISGQHVLLLLILGIFCTAIAHTLFIRGMKAVSGQTAGLIALAEPVYAILLAMALFREIPSFRTIAGGILIMAAAVCVTRNPS